MPTIINPYGNSKTMGEDIFGLGGIADAFFGPKASQSALYREKFKEAARQNEYTPLLAENVRRLGLPGGNVNAALSDAIMSGTPINEITAANLAATTNANPSTLGGNIVTAASLGAKVPYGSTVAGTNAHLASTAAIDREKTARLILADEQKTARTPVTVFDPTSSTGTKTIFMADLQAAPPGTYDVVPSQDVLKSATAARYLLPSAGAAPAAVAAAPLPSLGLSPDNPLTGIMSVPAFGGAAPRAAPPKLTPQLEHYLGAQPKDVRGENFYITDAFGNIIDQGVTEDSGRTRIDGTPIVLGEGHKINLASTTNPTALSGLGAPGGAVKEIRESRIATRTAVAQIDNVVRDLEKPNANAALGLVGQGAVMINNLRSQVDALTGTARELGYGKHADLFAAGAKEYIDNNPNLLKLAQDRGIDRGVLQSQISSLGYVIARANNQGGTLGVRDVEDAMREIGANMHDPKAFSAVLKNVKSRLEQQQTIREGVTAETVPPTTAQALRRGAASPPAVSGATGVPSGTTSTGVPWTVEP